MCRRRGVSQFPAARSLADQHASRQANKTEVFGGRSSGLGPTSMQRRVTRISKVIAGRARCWVIAGRSVQVALISQVRPLVKRMARILHSAHKI